MAPSRSDMIKVCEILAQDNNLRVSFRESTKGALYAGGGALLGGILGGPLGLAIGGSAGACYGAVKGRGKFKPVVEVIMFDMNERQRQQLAERVTRIVTSFNAGDFVTLMAIVSSNPSLQGLIMKEIGNFLSSEMSLTLL